MFWSKSEKDILRKLKCFDSIQEFLDKFEYNNSDSCISPRYSILTRDAHCFEGALLAAAAFEFHGQAPLILDLMCLDFDDPHVIAIFKYKNCWGSIGKSSTTMLTGRTPVYRNIRELVMSYFDFYFDKKGRKSLISYSVPINLNSYNSYNWRTTDQDLMDMGIAFNKVKHNQIISRKELIRLSPANKKIIKGCFLD